MASLERARSGVVLDCSIVEERVRQGADSNEELKISWETQLISSSIISIGGADKVERVRSGTIRDCSIVEDKVERVRSGASMDCSIVEEVVMVGLAALQIATQRAIQTNILTGKLQKPLNSPINERSNP